MRLLYTRALYCVSILPFLSVSGAMAAPEIIERYPACEYDVLDTIKATSIVNFEKVSTSASEMAESVALLVEELKNDAKHQPVAGIAITDKTMKQIRNQSARLTLSAQLIGKCKQPSTGEGALTPYNTQGLKQNSLSLGTVSFGHTITIDTRKKTAEHTALSDDTSVNLENGVYGLPLGATKQQMLDAFGTPTFEIALSKSSRLFAYGRDHWLTFVDDALVRVSTTTDLFTGTFINYLPFDERFDDRNWQISDALRRSASLTASEANAQQIRQSSDDARLQVMTETYTTGNATAQDVKVTGFDLTLNDTQLPENLPAVMTDNSVLAFFSEQLHQGNGTVSFSDIPYTDIGRTRVTRDGQYHLFNAFTLVEVMGKSVSNIYVNPNFVSPVSAKEGDWQFGQFYFGQSEEAALAAAGDMAFYFDHMLEYEGDNFTAKIYLERQDGEYRVYSMEVSVY